MEKYPEYIMKYLRQRRGLDPNDISQDDRIMKMSKEEALNDVASWNGLINYGYTIKSWVEQIYGIDLE